MIVNALTISLIVLFIHATTWEGHIFEGVKKLIKPEGKLYKPIYGCPICMTPWWGSAMYFMTITRRTAEANNLLFRSDLNEYFLTIGAAAGFSVLWVLLIDIKDNTQKL